MPRFILIEASLRAKSGHFHEYAHNVLGAARARGYDVFLASGEAYAEQVDFPCFRLYEYDVWGKRDGSKDAPKAGNDEMTASFKATTARVLENANAETGDMVFITSMGHQHIRAVRELMVENMRASRVSWHMVFLRPLYQNAREPDYDLDNAVALEYRAALGDMTPEHAARMFFYCDTPGNAEQYNTLGGPEFQVLPIPVFGELRGGTRSEAREPYRVIFCGASRHVKGYEHLPGIVEALWKDYAEAGRVKFDFQSFDAWCDDYWTPETDAARECLCRMPAEYLSLRKEPLSNEEYIDFVNCGDICLLPYDRLLYYSGSSGVLAECLCAGVSPVVPSASWLSLQLCEDNYAHVERLMCERLSTLFTAQQKGLSSWYDVPEGAQYLTVSFFTAQSVPPGNYVRTSVDFSDAGDVVIQTVRSEDYGPKSRGVRISLIFPVPEGARAVGVAFSNAFYDTPIAVDCAEIALHKGPAAGVPLGDYGLVYSQVEDIPALLKNMINHFGEYRRAAIIKARRYGSENSTEKLVDILITNAKKVKPCV